MIHRIPVPTRLQRPLCSCGWTPPLPWPVSWEQFDKDATEHLAQFVHCERHGDTVVVYPARCRVCANEIRRRITDPDPSQPEETR